MEITEDLLTNLIDEARKSSKLRASFDLRNTQDDNSQRVLHAMEPGSVIPIHRHMASSETSVLIRGALKMLIFNDDGTLKETFVVDTKNAISFYMIPIGTWHTCEVLESGTIMFEAKDGRYEAITEDDIMVL